MTLPRPRELVNILREWEHYEQLQSGGLKLPLNDRGPPVDLGHLIQRHDLSERIKLIPSAALTIEMALPDAIQQPRRTIVQRIRTALKL